mmetsp:Transcript_21502/g.30805  ORF Transcript_21502/g.30805 Transcript_21502/m.30805 type:complete len:297 (+) Transcript_21502:34-924(+)
MVMLFILILLKVSLVSSFKPNWKPKFLPSVLSSSIYSAPRSDVEILQKNYFDEILQQFTLKLTDFSESYNVKNWEHESLSGSVEWWDETKGSKLTGVSKYSIHDSSENNPYSCYSVNVWLGPTLLVPNMLLQMGHKSDGYFFTTDYIARGPYPIGNDFNYLDSYYSNKHIESYYDEIFRLDGVKHLPPSPSFAARLIQSPIHVSAGGLSLSDLQKFSSLHVHTWLQYMKDATPVEARQRGAINTRDDKLRQFAYRATVSEYNSLFSSAGIKNQEYCQRLGAASTGPISEPYVGGGS